MHSLRIHKAFIFIVICFIYINLGLCQYDETGNFETKAIGTKNTSSDQSTGVNVTKIVEGVGGKPLIRYEIKTPNVDDFEFVLALDSSGSFGSGGEIDQGDAVVYAIPKFINGILNNQIKDKKYQNKKFNISILSWDDDIDFAYSNLRNKIPENAKLVPIANAKNDTEINRVFAEVYELNEQEDFSGKYYIGESEGTNISLAIESSLAILNTTNNPLNINKRTHRFIILVVGPSEYPRVKPELIEAIKKSNIPVYVVGIDIRGNSRMMSDLEEISDSKNYSQRFKNIKAIGDQLNVFLFEALDKSLDDAIIDPVAENVTLIESFYSYFDPDTTAIISTADGANSYRLSGTKISNYDDTKTIVFNIPFKLLPNTTTDIEFGVKFNLKGLPVSITKTPKNFIFDPISNSTQFSHIRYMWTVNEKREVKLDLPETEIDIVSTEGETDTAKTTEETSRTSGNNELGIIALLSVAITYIMLKPGN
jgi:hypothetical protein